MKWFQHALHFHHYSIPLMALAMKKEEAETKGIVEKEDSDRAYLDLPEGEHMMRLVLRLIFVVK